MVAFQSLRSSTIGPYCRSKQSFQAGVEGGRRRVDGWRSWATTRGNSAVAPSMKRQKRLPILKTPGHRAQKPRFCARKARKRGFRRAKAHKNLNFVLKTPENGGFGSQKSTKTPILCSGRRGLAVGREDIGIGKRNRGLPANHRARFQNANAS